jgi:3'-phosphoadenosine 5'-phosphosulfate sulfotransferase (PAPS reductase)/FAD synthetase
MTSEPILRAEDHAAWASWQRAASLHAKTRGYARRVDAARRVSEQALALEGSTALMWSGGKDSTVMTHLVCVGLGARVPVFSEKDDLDYPGEREYVERLASAWGLDLRVLVPPVSPAQWLAENGRELDGASDLHSRAAGLSKACFYNVVESATRDVGTIFLGLRAEESRGRNANRAAHGLLYTRRSGQWVCNPLGDWTGLDVFAYAVANDVELLHVYRCIALMHRHEPWHVRKSWWVPGKSAAYGGAVWLRHYYPSLFRQLCGWVPSARLVG